MEIEVVDTRKHDRYTKVPVEIPDEQFQVLREFSILEPFGVLIDEEIRIYAEAYPEDIGEIVQRIQKTLEVTYRPTTDTVQVCVKYPAVLV